MATRNSKMNQRRRYVPDIEIPNAYISGQPNFAGNERVRNGRIVNSEGNRNFCVNIPAEGVQNADDPDVLITPEELIDMGWNLKIHANSGSDTDVPSYYLPVNVNFDYRPPVIWSITGKKRVRLNEQNVDLLDGRNFRRVNLVIHPAVRQDWDTDDVRISAYLNEGWFYIATSSFEEAWQEDHQEEDE